MRNPTYGDLRKFSDFIRVLEKFDKRLSLPKGLDHYKWLKKWTPRNNEQNSH